MYYPIQIPYLLNEAYGQTNVYFEEVLDPIRAFVICFWDMLPRGTFDRTAENVIVTDGCIDLVANMDEGMIGFVGKSKTDFHFTVAKPCRFIGARMMPGAFHQLTGLPARAAMDSYLPVSQIDRGFDEAQFFSLPFPAAKAYMKDFLTRLVGDQKPDQFTDLFPCLSHEVPQSTTALYEQFHLSARQCQRLFQLHFGLSPKQVLSILRFQQCLTILKGGKARPGDVLAAVHYYDQPHLIRDFKENIGITPLELIGLYQA